MPQLFHRLARSLLRIFKRQEKEEEEEPEDNRWNIIENELRKKLRRFWLFGFGFVAEETSHALHIRTVNTSRAPSITRPDDDDDARFDGPPSPGHVRDPRFPSPHIVPIPAPPRPHLAPPSHTSSLDSFYQGRRLGVDHSSSGRSNSTISNLDLDSWLFAAANNERRPVQYVHSSMERVTEDVAMWEPEETV
ncbi:hypothetical protein JCM5353_008245 [Sporobolomyces roseus]